MSENGATHPIIDVPFRYDDEMDTETLAETMTDKEQKALLVMVFRQNREILEFIRFLKDMAGPMMNGQMPMPTMPGMPNIPDLGNIPKANRPNQRHIQKRN